MTFDAHRPMRSAVVTALLVLFPAVLGCTVRVDPTEAVQLTSMVDPAPAHVGPARVELTLAESGKPLEGARLRVEGNMNHAGMVPSPATVKELGAGRYEARLEFTMGGDWFLLVEGSLADGRSLERTVDVPGVAVN